MEELLGVLLFVAAVVIVSLMFGYATYLVLNAVTPFNVSMSVIDIFIVGLTELVMLNMLGGGD